MSNYDSNPLVSVIIPAYNHECFVSDTIKSIIEQTYKNIELIVIDDGSKDNTYAIIESLKDKCFKRFKNTILKKQNNRGTCETLNSLWSYASGKYIYIIASDDIAKRNSIEVLVAFLEKNQDYVLAVGDNEVIDQNSRLVGLDYHKKTMDLDKAVFRTYGSFLSFHHQKLNFNSSKFGTYRSLVLANYIPNGYLISSNAINQIGHNPFKKEAPLEDWFLHLQLSKIGKMKYIDKILCSYRVHTDNTSSKEEYMIKVNSMTRNYEESIVKKDSNRKWKKIYIDEWKRIKTNGFCFNFFDIFKYYTKIPKDIKEKQIIIELFNKKIIIKRENFLY